MEIGEEAEEDDEGPVHPNWLQVHTTPFYQSQQGPWRQDCMIPSRGQKGKSRLTTLCERGGGQPHVLADDADAAVCVVLCDVLVRLGGPYPGCPSDPVDRWTDTRRRILRQGTTFFHISISRRKQ
jgi:hypothetical protein